MNIEQLNIGELILPPFCRRYFSVFTNFGEVRLSPFERVSGENFETYILSKYSQLGESQLRLLSVDALKSYSNGFNEGYKRVELKSTTQNVTNLLNYLESMHKSPFIKDAKSVEIKESEDFEKYFNAGETNGKGYKSMLALIDDPLYFESYLEEYFSTPENDPLKKFFRMVEPINQINIIKYFESIDCSQANDIATAFAYLIKSKIINIEMNPGRYQRDCINFYNTAFGTNYDTSKSIVNIKSAIRRIPEPYTDVNNDRKVSIESFFVLN